jgi:thiamine-phosphate pyrophosphorylase
MRLLVISATDKIENEHVIIRKMFDMGLTTLHLRKPKLSTENMKKYLDDFAEEYQKKMIIHTHHGLIWDYPLKGIHLTKSHKKNRFKSWVQHSLYKMKRKDMIRTTSCGSVSTLSQIYNDFEYVMLTPIFADKQEHRPTFSRGTLDIVMTKFPKKIVARGGATLAEIEKANDIGFSGIAFHKAIWESPDPLKQFENILNRYKELGIPID